MDEAKGINSAAYYSKHTGHYDEKVDIRGSTYVKVEDLRYGTNPHQTAALYKPAHRSAVIGDLQVLKSGKNGLSQTNYEDISCALNICKYFDTTTSVCMKHVNPSGAAVGVNNESAAAVYRRARDCDPQAAFGSVVAFNSPVDEEAAREIMTSFVEVVVAPEVTEGALNVLCDHETYRVNRNIRVLRCGDLRQLPRFVGDDTDGVKTLTVLGDGSIVVADPLVSNVRSVDDITPATAETKDGTKIAAQRHPDEREQADLITAWYINLSVRSNGVVIVKNGATLAVGTGQQDRVGAVREAVRKYESKYGGQDTIQGSVMASDGFFPFPDALEIAAAKGVTAVVAPAGSMRDAQVIESANQHGVAFCHAPERVFSHH